MDAKLDSYARDLRSENDLQWFRLSSLLDVSLGVNRPPRTPEVIVSLTTIPHRSANVHLVIESLFQQTMRPDRVILWLDRPNFEGLPTTEQLERQRARGLEIRYCDDVRSYKKLVFTLEEHPDAIVVTADDDIMYPSEWLESLYRRHLEHPDCIVCHRAHWVRKGEDGNVLRYSDWEYESQRPGPSFNLSPTGSGGILYPPGALSDQVLDREAYMALCPTEDDLWFKAMAMKAGTKAVIVPGNLMRGKGVSLIRNSQEVALWSQNVSGNGNESQVKNVFTHFDLVHLFE
jgi:hypothetical protein